MIISKRELASLLMTLSSWDDLLNSCNNSLHMCRRIRGTIVVDKFDKMKLLNSHFLETSNGSPLKYRSRTLLPWSVSQLEQYCGVLSNWLVWLVCNTSTKKRQKKQKTQKKGWHLTLGRRKIKGSYIL